jgi:Ca2+-binding RTX toxin-like protein
VVYASEGASAYGGAGNDEVIVSGPGQADGGSSNDGITNDLGDPLITCGSGRDTVFANQAASVKNCEIATEYEYPT